MIQVDLFMENNNSSHTSNSIDNLNNTIESTNLLDAVMNSFYYVYLNIKYAWYFNILGYSKDKYLSDVADPVYDGLRDKGYLDKINTDVKSVSNSKVQVDTNISSSTGYFNSLNPFANGSFKLSNNNTSTTDLVSDTTSVDASSTNQSWLLGAAGKIGLNNTRDTDGDGIPDIIDSRPYDAANLTAADMNTLFEADYNASDKVRMFFNLGPKDTDGDGLPDSYESKIDTSPLSSDTDMDGISDYQELVEGTNPLNPDTDGDGVLDGRDMDPLDKSISVRPDVSDIDHDGVADIIEKYIGGDINKVDTDDDGIPDGMDVVINGDNAKVTNYNSTYPSTLKFDSVGWMSDHLHIENGLIYFATDILIICLIVLLMAFASAFSKWYFAFKKATRHYEHTFNPSIHRDESREHHHIDPTMTENADSEEVEANLEKHYPNIHHAVSPYKDEWQIVENYMQDDMEAMWKLGIIEADNLLYKVLNEKGYHGDTLGDMLKSAHFNSISQAWDAHKVRNRIAHEGSSYTLTDREARRIFALYEEVLRELKAI